jgi:citrate synthase
MAERVQLRSDIAWSTPNRITIKGYDLCDEILGVLSLGDMAFLELMDRLPTQRESVLFNAIAVALVEHGLTPSAIAARMTYSGAPEAMQAAVAAGILGLGTVFVGSMESAARMPQEAPDEGGASNEPDAVARDIVKTFFDQRQPVPGLGHHFHKPVDPRAIRLFDIAEKEGASGQHIALMKAISHQAELQYGKPLPVNVTGAIGAIASEIGIPWSVVRGIGVMARAIGLVGHIREEIAYPIAREIKQRSEDEAIAHLRTGNSASGE